MYWLIWLLLVVFCLSPVVVSQIVLKQDEKMTKELNEKGGVDL